MKVCCDVCEAATATLFCASDSAAMCAACDERVHSANKLAGKHPRLALSQTPKGSVPCDICQEAGAVVFCREDRALLCRQCDVAIHSANAVAGTHVRVLMPGTRMALDPMPVEGEAGEASAAGGSSISADNAAAAASAAKPAPPPGYSGMYPHAGPAGGPARGPAGYPYGPAPGTYGGYPGMPPHPYGMMPPPPGMMHYPYPYPGGPMPPGMAPPPPPLPGASAGGPAAGAGSARGAADPYALYGVGDSADQPLDLGSALFPVDDLLNIPGLTASGFSVKDVDALAWEDAGDLELLDLLMSADAAVPTGSPRSDEGGAGPMAPGLSLDALLAPSAPSDPVGLPKARGGWAAAAGGVGGAAAAANAPSPSGSGEPARGESSDSLGVHIVPDMATSAAVVTKRRRV